MKVDPELERAVLDLVRSDNYQPIKPKVIAKKLRLDDEQFRELKRTIKWLVKQGKLTYGAHHLVKPSNEKKSRESALLVGIFKKTSQGFGFLIQDDVSPEQPKQDIYIPEQDSLDASDGDRVGVKLSRGRGFKGRPMGRIVEVVSRRTNQFVGTFRPDDHTGYVVVDKGVFSSPVYVGDTTAKNVSKGDKVVVEMVHFPSQDTEGEGVIIEVLGDKHKAGVDTRTVMREFGLPDVFPVAVLEAAAEEAQRFENVGLDGRTDLTSETIITIDPKDARDFDDAISLQRMEGGHWRLGVHIADVSHFVKPGSPLDDEAFKRATSVYLPDRVIPMIPEQISNSLASLQPDKVRFTTTAFIEFTAEGIPVATDVCKAAIKSKWRFTYEEVDEFLGRPSPWKEKLPEDVFRLLTEMHVFAMLLRKRRLDQGAIELLLPEIKIDLNRHGKVTGAHIVEYTESHQIIEEFMLAANNAVATMLADKQVNYLRRIHEPPDPKKLHELTSFVRELGFECTTMESRFEMNRVIAEASKQSLGYAVNYAVLRSMQKAIYAPRDEGHYALNMDHYCHFTSPIRRYPDLVIHRLVEDLIQQRRPSDELQKMTRIGRHCSEREKLAERAERELIKLKMLNFMSQKIGEEMEAVITGVESYGVFAQGIKLPAEGLVTRASLGDDHYDYDGAAHCLTGRRHGNQFRLGDRVLVKIARIDLERRELDLAMVDNLTQKAGGQRKTKKKRSPDQQVGRRKRKSKKRRK